MRSAARSGCCSTIQCKLLPPGPWVNDSRTWVPSPGMGLQLAAPVGGHHAGLLWIRKYCPCEGARALGLCDCARYCPFESVARTVTAGKAGRPGDAGNAQPRRVHALWTHSGTLGMSASRSQTIWGSADTRISTSTRMPVTSPARVGHLSDAAMHDAAPGADLRAWPARRIQDQP